MAIQKDNKIHKSYDHLRLLEILYRLENQFSILQQLYLNPDSRQIDYLLSNEDIVFRKRKVMCFVGSVPSLILLTTVLVLVYTGIEWQLTGTWLTSIVDWISLNIHPWVASGVSFGSGVAIALYVFFHLVPWGVGKLTLTGTRLYFNGFLLNRSVPLSEVSNHRVVNNRLTVILPQNEELRFYVGKEDAEMLCQVLAGLKTRKKQTLWYQRPPRKARRTPGLSKRPRAQP
ncbi:MAG: hypothetical protein F4Z18_02390 [Caldilineaceae bacterium SB0666_bin_21]|nr:hypothetical protein [Caldilineaceae bacterium SB0666_bin_21]